MKDKLLEERMKWISKRGNAGWEEVIELCAMEGDITIIHENSTMNSITSHLT